MKNEYVIMSCTKTVELLEWGHRMFGMWAPTEQITVTNAKGQSRLKLVPPIPGLVYVPWGVHMSAKSQAPNRFRLKIFQYDLIGRPRCCTLDDLRKMDAAVHEKQEDLWLNVNDLVASDTNPLLPKGTTAAVLRIRADNTVKLRREDGQYINVDKRFLKRVEHAYER